MTLKAISVSALAVLALAGTACSDSEASARESQQATGPSEDDFNLGLGTPAAPSMASEDDFNLGPPGLQPTAGADDFSFNTDMTTSNGLADVPELDIGPLPTQQEEPAEPTPSDLDDVIRLD